MSGISSSVGVFSGINSGQLIEQLLAIQARPREQARARVVQLQLQKSAWLDINTRLSALRTAAQAFRTNNVFTALTATSSDAQALSATATSTAAPGSYRLLVDRLVSTQQFLSRGFADRDASGAGLTSLTIEGAQARLDTDVALSELNDGSGIRRGRIQITDSGGRAATIDLSRVATVNEVLEAINGNGTAQVRASVQGGRLVLTDLAGGNFSVSNVGGGNTATDLGIAGTGTGGTLSGSLVYGLNRSTSLSRLNDGRGVSINSSVGTDAFNFSITVNDGGDITTVRVNLGDVYQNVPPAGGGDPVLTKVRGAATTMGEVLDRINTALSEAGVGEISASIDAANGRLRLAGASLGTTIAITDNGGTSAQDLGLATASPQSSPVQGRRLLAGLNTTLLSGLNGGAGVSGDGTLNFTARDGTSFSVNVNRDWSVSELADAVRSASGGRITLGLNSAGTGLQVNDTTGGTGPMIVTGTNGADTAASLRISTGASGVNASTFRGANAQRQYISRATLLSSLNGGRGIGTGEIRLTDATGDTRTVNIGADSRTIGDVIDEINSRGLALRARINANGDGIEIFENTGGAPAGSARIKVEDVSGSVGRSLNIAGEASGTGPANVINGTFERTVTLNAADTLQQIVTKVNQAGAGVTAAIVRDGVGSNPFRLSFTALGSGSQGRVAIDAGSFDLDLSTLDEGRDARAFLGADDPARAVLVSSSTNTVDDLVPGLRLDLLRAGNDPVTVTVASDTGAIERALSTFVSAFNTAADRLRFQTRFDPETRQRGPLLGDGTATDMRAALFRQLTAPASGVTGRYSRLTDIGIRIESGGRVALDTDRLRAVLQEDPEAVEALLTARQTEPDQTIDLGGGVTVRNPNAGSSFSSLGVMEQFARLADRYTNTTDGIGTSRSRGIDNQIALQNARIDQFTARLEVRRGILEQQFRAMEQALGQLQQQQGALTRLGAAR